MHPNNTHNKYFNKQWIIWFTINIQTIEVEKDKWTNIEHFLALDAHAQNFVHLSDSGDNGAMCYFDNYTDLFTILHDITYFITFTMP